MHIHRHVPSLLDLLQRHPQAQRFDLGNHTLAAIPSQHIDAGAFGGSGNGVMLTLDRPLELSNGKLQFCEGMHCMVTSPGVACKSIAFICGDAAWGATHSIANAAYAHGRTTGKVTAGSISMQGLVSVAGQGASLAMEDCQVVNYSLHRVSPGSASTGSLTSMAMPCPHTTMPCHAPPTTQLPVYVPHGRKDGFS